ncbi:MAG: glycosyltransferase family 4 protein [Maribacter sp.]
MDRKKILYVHHSGGLGGAPKSMGYIIKNLDQKKFSPTLLNISEGPINDFFRELPCELIILKKGIRPFHGSYVVKSNLFHYLYGWFFLIPSIILAYKHIKRIKPDLIHLNSSCLFAFAIAAHFFKIKTICHVREPIRKGWAGWPLRFFCKAYVSGFIAISQYDLDSLQFTTSNTQPREVIYNFVENFSSSITSLESPIRSEFNVTKNGTLFLYLARFAESNGWIKLIEMAREVVRKNSNAHFILVGAQTDNHFINTGHDNIQIIGYRSDIEELLNGTDVFVCPFVLPHFARGVIEAAAYSRPSIGSDVGGVNELIKDKFNGFLYQSENEFVSLCQVLIDDIDKRKLLGSQAYNYAIQNFDLKKNLEKTYDFYTNFVSEE